MEIVSAQEAAGLVGDNAVVVIGGSGAGHAVPESLRAAIEERLLASGRPSGAMQLGDKLTERAAGPRNGALAGVSVAR